LEQQNSGTRLGRVSQQAIGLAGHTTLKQTLNRDDIAPEYTKKPPSQTGSFQSATVNLCRNLFKSDP